jgi:hypothetical protein
MIQKKNICTFFYYQPYVGNSRGKAHSSQRNTTELSKGKKGPSPSPLEAADNDSWITFRPEHLICLSDTRGILCLL